MNSLVLIRVNGKHRTYFSSTILSNELNCVIAGGFLDQNRRISSLGRLSKGGNASTKVTDAGAPVCTLTATSSRSLHGGGPPTQTPTPTPQSTSTSVKHQLHSSVEPSLSLSKPAVRLAFAGTVPNTVSKCNRTKDYELLMFTYPTISPDIFKII